MSVYLLFGDEGKSVHVRVEKVDKWGSLNVKGSLTELIVVLVP